MTYQCRRSFIGVCRGGVCVTDLRRRCYIGIAEGVSALRKFCADASPCGFGSLL